MGHHELIWLLDFTIKGLVQDWDISISNAMKISQSCTKPLIFFEVFSSQNSLFLWCPSSCHRHPASIATLAQRWPNVNPYVGPTSGHQRWANVDLSIGPTLAQRLHANVGPTLCQHRPNVGTLTLGQRWHNVMPMVVCQRCTNIGPTEAALLAFCEGNPSVTDRSPVEQTVELSNQWFETPMWSTSM